jgi:hypothetical protein
MRGRKQRGRGRGPAHGYPDGGFHPGRGRGRGGRGPSHVAMYEDDGDFAIDTMNFRMSNLSRHL